MDMQSSAVIPDSFAKVDTIDALTKELKKKRPSTNELFDKATSMGVDPFEILLQIADGNKMALDLDDGPDSKPISVETRAAAAREVLKFMYPTMKSAEVSGPNGTPLDMAVKVVFEEGVAHTEDEQQETE